jgi:hypothetical protein
MNPKSMCNWWWQWNSDTFRTAALELENVRNAACCSVIVSRCFNAHLLRWQLVYWSMLGSLFRTPEQKPSHSEAEPYREAAPSERLDAVIILEQIPIGFLRFQKHMSSWKTTKRRRPDDEEYLSELQRKLGTESDITLAQLRVVVHENPFSVRPLPRDLFHGPYDKRYGLREDGEIGLVFLGAEIQQFEVTEVQESSPPIGHRKYRQLEPEEPVRAIELEENEGEEPERPKPPGK